LKPVGPALLWRSQELSELTENLPPLPFIRSYSSLMPFGGAMVILLLPPKKPTTGVSSSVVVRPGAAIKREFDW
jgi:hypothetical protein